MHVTTILGLLVGRVFGPTLLLLLTILSPSHVLAQTAGGAAETAGTTPVPVFRICDPPPVCFASVEARQAWAAQNRCRFLEDVCTQTTPENDHRGAQQEDRGFWGNLWHGIESQLVYGYEFVKGLLTGLKDQVADLFSLVTNIDEAVQGLVALGRAFHDDPQATLRTLAGLLGQAAVDTITRATHCGAYDLGRVVGQHVNPAVMLRLATRLSRYGDDLGAAVNATRHDFGCASFAAGTPVLTDRGRVPIEQIRIGQIVLSRDGRSQTDIPRPVTDVFSRTASSHRILRTEYDTLRVTDEHPFWVQGKGWTQAKDVTDEDVIAGREGDALVLSNQEVKQALKVFNFSVADTASYFVGEGGSWAHNAKCSPELVHARLPNGQSASEFEKSLVNLAPNNRVAIVRQMAADVARARNWRKDSRLSRINRRDVYVGGDGNLYAVDSQHGRFERVAAKTGKHQGEVRMDITPVSESIDLSGGHDLELG